MPDRQAYLIKKLATPTLPPLNFRLENVRPYFKASINGEWKNLPVLSNQRFNRVLSKEALKEGSATLPIHGEKTILPSLALRERLKFLQALSATTTTSAPPSATTAPLPSTKERSDQDLITRLQEALSRKEEELAQERGKETALDLKLKKYQESIQQLSQRNQHLKTLIQEEESRVQNLQTTLYKIRAQDETQQENLHTQAVKLTQLKKLLENQRGLIEVLQEQINTKEKNLNDLKQRELREKPSIVKVQSELKALKAMIANFRATLANAQKSGLDPSQIQKLKGKLKEKEDQLSFLQPQALSIAGEEQIIPNLQKELQVSQQKMQDLLKEKAHLTQEVERLEQEAEKFKVTASQSQVEKQKQLEVFKKQQQELTRLQEEKERLSQFASELAKKISQAQHEKKVEQIIHLETQEAPATSPVKEIIKVKPKTAIKLPQLTKIPNTVSGIVTDADGKLLKNAIVIIKKDYDHPTRALKTDALGQFIASSSLPNGIYLIEAEKEGLKFDILEIELNGKVVPPIQITAHEY